MAPNSPEPQPSTARNIYVFGLTSFLNDTASEMAYWVLPAFLVSLGAGPAQLGLIEGLAESVASFAKLFSGYLTDRIDRRKPLVVAGYFVANAVKPLLALVTAWWHILLIRFSDRLAKGVRGAPRDVMVAESVGKESPRFGLRPDSVDGLRRRDRRTVDGVAPARALRNSQHLLGGCGPGNAGCVWSHSLASGRPGTPDHFIATPRRMTPGQRNRIPPRRYSRQRAAGCVLLRSRGSDFVFAGEFQRHVSGDAGAEHRHSRVSCSAAWPGLQPHLHSRLMARRMVQRSLFAAMDCGRWIYDFCRQSISSSDVRRRPWQSGSRWLSMAFTTR